MYDNDPKHFYVTLFSNVSQSLYPKNTISEFTVELPRPIELGTNDEWEVALCEISYPTNTVGTLISVEVVGVSVLVYTDLISPQYVGKKIGPMSENVQLSYSKR